jgi:4-hydroxythreonine-4-phosphate dehydrogenase
MRSWRPKVAISMGDPNGVGPEVALRCVANPDLQAIAEMLLVGSRGVFEVHAEALGVAAMPFEVLAAPEAQDGHRVVFGQITASGGQLSMVAVDAAIELCLSAQADAMVTAPISKEAIAMAGYDVPGHTEFLAARCGAEDHLMMMVAGPLRVGVVTGHIPISRVAENITRRVVATRLNRLAAAIGEDFGIEQPRVAVLGLNPHAGDGGVLGHEEEDVIRPAMKLMTGGLAFGPFPADGFFAEKAYLAYDGVLAMYHDQGLIPFKTLAFDTGVNFTAGLSIVRTSPDHGTAYDIAGQAKARPDSMENAIRVAVQVARVRHERSGSVQTGSPK